VKVITTSAEQTRAFGERLAAGLLPGDVLLLWGDMGAGKSELTRGIAKGLGVIGVVPSPSFVVLQAHSSGRVPLYHFDWYRLSGVGELFELSMDEYLYGDGVAVVEWPGKAEEALPERHLRVDITPDGEDGRIIELTPRGGFREISDLIASGDGGSAR